MAAFAKRRGPDRGPRHVDHPRRFDQLVCPPRRLTAADPQRAAMLTRLRAQLARDEQLGPGRRSRCRGAPFPTCRSNSRRRSGAGAARQAPKEEVPALVHLAAAAPQALFGARPPAFHFTTRSQFSSWRSPIEVVLILPVTETIKPGFHSTTSFRTFGSEI
jgi:hypothetical protein